MADSFRFDIKDKVIRSKLQELNDAMRSKKNAKAMGDFLVEEILDRTRGRYRGVKATGKNVTKLKDVTPEWAKRRVKESGRHPQAARGRKSNLTHKGDMLDNLQTLPTFSGLVIGFTSTKQAEKAEGNEARGRAFMYLSKGEISKATDFLRRKLLKNI